MGKLTMKDVQAETYFSKQLYNKMKKKIDNYESDNDKDRRLKVRKCKSCFYLREGQLAGQAFTSSNCRNCDCEITNATTSTNKICGKCSDELNLCTKCGGEMD